MATEKRYDIGAGETYTTLSAFEAAIPADLQTADEYWIADCKAFTDTTEVQFTGHNSDATRNITVRAVSTARHSGVWTTGCYILGDSTGFDHQIEINEPYFEVDGIQIVANGSGDYYGSCMMIQSQGAGQVKIDNCIMKSISGYRVNNEPYGIYANGGVSGESEIIRNCVIYNMDQDGASQGGFGIAIGYGTAEIYNCTVFDCRDGIQTGGATETIKNCAVFNTRITDIEGTPSTIEYCAGDDAIFATGTGNVRWTSGATDWNANFTSYDAADPDVSVKDTNADIYDGGTTVGLSTDIAGTARGATYDIGAFEFAGGTSIPIFQNYYRQQE